MDSMKILLMNSNDKKKVDFGFDQKLWVGFEKHPSFKHSFLLQNKIGI